jgi:hypothetical protein
MSPTRMSTEQTRAKRPVVPPWPEELKAVLHRMRLPYVRAAAPEVLATAKA